MYRQCVSSVGFAMFSLFQIHPPSGAFFNRVHILVRTLSQSLDELDLSTRGKEEYILKRVPTLMCRTLPNHPSHSSRLPTGRQTCFHFSRQHKRHNPKLCRAVLPQACHGMVCVGLKQHLSSEPFFQIQSREDVVGGRYVVSMAMNLSINWDG